MPVEFEPLSPQWRSDPYAKYRELRDHAPVHFAPQAGIWCISRYADVEHVLRHPELFSSRAMYSFLMNGGNDGLPPLSPPVVRFLLGLVREMGVSSLGMLSPRTLIAEDGDAHGHTRRVVNRGFTPRRIAAWKPRIEELAHDCMSATQQAGSFDLMHELAVPLPVAVIAEMLGVAPERMGDFKRWSDAIIDGTTGAGRGDRFNACLTSVFFEIVRYLQDVARERRRDPTDDLISSIVAQQDGVAGLSDADVIVFVMVLLVAGNETTTNLIGNAISALLDHPAEREAIERDDSLLSGWIEETLRFDPPIQLVFRTTTEDVEVAGVRIPKGALVAPLIGAANRDERRFEEPDRFDIRRQPTGHLGFGFGEHFCLGASLARLEAHCALAALLPELPRFERTDADREYVDSFLVRGLRRLEVQRGGPGAQGLDFQATTRV